MSYNVSTCVVAAIRATRHSRTHSSLRAICWTASWAPHGRTHDFTTFPRWRLPSSRTDALPKDVTECFQEFRSVWQQVARRSHADTACEKTGPPNSETGGPKKGSIFETSLHLSCLRGPKCGPKNGSANLNRKRANRGKKTAPALNVISVIGTLPAPRIRRNLSKQLLLYTSWNS